MAREIYADCTNAQCAVAAFPEIHGSLKMSAMRGTVADHLVGGDAPVPCAGRYVDQQFARVHLGKVQEWNRNAAAEDLLPLNSAMASWERGGDFFHGSTFGNEH